MIVLGLTGGIATGKSTISAMLKRARIPVFDADAAVHFLLAADVEIRTAIAEKFPTCLSNAAINRKKLGEIIFCNDADREWLENLIHPRVRAMELAFIAHHTRARTRVIVLDVPLLFETGADILCDAVLVTQCPEFLKRQRALRRPGMTPEKYTCIAARQMPDGEKIHRADFVIHTGLGKGYSARILQSLLRRQ